MEPRDLDPIHEDEVMRLLGPMSAKTFRRMVADGDFPDGFPAGRGLGKRWYRKDVDAYLWLRMRLAEKPPKRARKKSNGAAAKPADGESK